LAGLPELRWGFEGADAGVVIADMLPSTGVVAPKNAVGRDDF
jgi:hypothetical protein